MVDVTDALPVNPQDEGQTLDRPLTTAFNRPVTYTARSPRYREASSLLEATGAVIDNDFITATLIRDIGNLLDGPEERDQDWNPDDDQSLRTLFEEYGLPVTEKIARRLRGTVSENHARRVLDRAMTEMQNEEKIASFFDGGNAESFLFRLGVSVFDPVGLLAGGAAGRLAGAGLVAKRAANLRRLADNFGELGHMAAYTTALTPLTSRTSWAAREALAAAAVDGSLEAYHISRSPTAGMDELAIAGLGSLAASGVFGALGYRGAQIDLIRRSAQRVEKETLEEAFRTLDAAYAPAPGEPQFDPAGSIGAARLRTGDEDLGEVDPLVAEFDPGQDSDFGNAVRFDAHADFMRSSNQYTRALAGMMLVDGAASNASRGKVQHFTVEEIAHNHERQFTTRFATALLGAYDAWKKANGLRTLDTAMDASYYNDFIAQVARAVRNPDSDVSPEIAQARDSFRTSMREQLRLAQEAGIMDEVPESDLYVPRFWRRDAFIEMFEKYGTERGTEYAARVIGRGLMKSYDDPELADNIARHLIRIITDKSVSNESLTEMANMSRERSIARLKALVGDEVDDDTMNALVDLFKGPGRDKNGQGPRSEFRLDLDENAEIMIEGRKLRLDDFLNNDLMSINTIYSRQIGGRIAFSEVSKGRFLTNQDIEDFFAKAEAEIALLPNAQKRMEEVKLKRLRAYSGYLLGHGSLGDDIAMSEDAQAFLKFLRDVSFARMMGQVGYAQLGEIGTAVGALGMKAFLQQIPSSMREVLTRYRPGVSPQADHISHTLADMTGLGNMHIMARMRSTSRQLDSDDVYGARDTAPGDSGMNQDGQRPGRIREVGSKLARGAELWARGTSLIGGLQPITDVTQTATAQALLASFARSAKDGTRLIRHVMMDEAAIDKRLLAMGVDPEMEARISSVLQEISEYDEAGNLKNLRLDQASDQEAVDHLFRVITRESRRIVQEGDLGTSRGIMVNPLIRAILQFKTFVMNSHVKQMLYGINMRDAQAMTEFLMSTLLAGMGQMAKYNLMTLGMSPESREDYLDYAFGEDDERFWKAMAAAIRNSSQSGLLPDAIDTLTQAALGQRFFDYRNTGLSSGFFDLESSAAYSTLKAPLAPFEELAQGDPDDAVRDLVRLGPNYTPVVILGNILQEQVPEEFNKKQ